MAKLTRLLFIPTVFGLWMLSGSTIGAKEFNVYWNVPTFMCDKRDVYINVTQYGIIQNTGDVFQGDKVNIWYHPGKFPYLNGNESVYGGIPQRGDIEDHISTFRDQVETMPQDFSGVAVLDFENYLPDFASAPKEYKIESRDWVASQHPTWTEEEIETESERSFNASIKEFMEVLLQIGVEMRPNALWGYYHYPYCKNYDEGVVCRESVTELNDKTLWIYEASGAMYPSIYLYEAYSVEGRRNMALGRMIEAKRLNDMISKPVSILTYCSHKYHSGDEFITPEDILNTIGLSKSEGLDGSVMWGSSGGLDTTEKCSLLKEYVETILGPLVQDILQIPESYLRRLLKSQENMKELIVRALGKLNTKV